MFRLLIFTCLLFTNVFDVLAATDETLEFFQEEAQVTTASRRPQSVQEAPVAVEVITTEEIKASGVTNLWDLMRFRLGMDILDGHQTVLGNRAIVSIRGFDEAFARNILVLVDGRSVYATDSGGVYWAQLPIGIQDIDRIEIIRGPNAALYGTGAALGVINIITKKPGGATTATIQGAGGNQGTVMTSEALNSSIRAFDFRLSHSYLEQGPFDSATGGTATNDFLHSNKANMRLRRDLTNGSDLEFFAGGSWNTSGFANAQESQDNFSQHFEMLKFQAKISDNSHLEISSSHSTFTNIIDPTPTGDINHLQNDRFDEEILHRIDWGNGRLNSTYGLNYQGTRVDSQNTFVGHPDVNDAIRRAFFNQTGRVTDQVTLVGALAFEGTRTEKPHANYQLASLWAPVENQSFRATYSVAHTVPTLRQLFVNQQLNDSVARVGNPDLKPEKLTSYEVGYLGHWLEHHLEAESNLFYTRIDGIDDDADLGPWPNNPSVAALGFVNTNQAVAKGAELQFKYRFTTRQSMYVNYTYEHITDKSGNEGEITKNTPPHKVNLGAMADFGGGFSGSFNLGYKDSYFITNITDSVTVPTYWRLDARLAYASPWYKNAEFYMAGQNLLKARHVEFADGLAVPRTYTGGVSITFD